MDENPASNGQDRALVPWPGGARVMVCVGYNPISQRLIQRAAHLAKTFGGELIAVHIRPAESQVPGYQTMLEHNLQLARQLGARVVIEQGAPIAQVLARVAQT